MLIPKLSLLAQAPKDVSVTLKDSTGAYNATTNPGGYGAPNMITPPPYIAIRARYWSAAAPYGHLIDVGAILTAILSPAGTVLTPASFGLTATAFSPGVHHLTYYPCEFKTVQGVLTQGSKVVTIVPGGTQLPLSWESNVKGVIFQAPGTSKKIYLIDRTQPFNNSVFSLTEPWEEASNPTANIYVGPEADVKVLFQYAANQCVVDRISALFDSCTCNAGEEYELMQDTMQLRAAVADFACADYNGANNKTGAVHNQCIECKTSCSCS